jgi:hypothetical protein
MDVMCLVAGAARMGVANCPSRFFRFSFKLLCDT